MALKQSGSPSKNYVRNDSESVGNTAIVLPPTGNRVHAGSVDSLADLRSIRHKTKESIFRSFRIKNEFRKNNKQRWLAISRYNLYTINLVL